MKSMHSFQKPAFFLILSFCLLGFSGCFETRFDFKTVVHRDGSVDRKTQIDGRGGFLFKIPSGKGWQAKSWKSEGDAALLPDVEYHVQAEGKFPFRQTIPSDYEFDLEKQRERWGEKEKTRLEEAGIKPPYEENLYSKNLIRIHRVKGWPTDTFFYEETFENKGILALLLLDLKDEVRKQSQARGEVLKEEEIEVLARLRLEEESLPEIRFSSEVVMPGKVISSNATQIEKGKTVWRFSMKDFQNDHSIYTLKVVSRSLGGGSTAFTAVAGLVGVGILILVWMGLRMRSFGNAKNSPKKKNPKK